MYIVTSPLLSSTSFHWALVHVNPDGVCSRHHWATYTADALGPEKYVENFLPGGAKSSTRNVPFLGYYKLTNGYVPVEILRAACEPVFAEASRAMKKAPDNRRVGVTCRTWLTKVLTGMVGERRAQDIEAVVKSRSTVRNNEYANCILWRRNYVTVVEAV